MGQQERLNRFLARAGIASRRESDRLILAGKIQVNEQRVDRPGTRIDPERDRVALDGRPVRPPPVFTYLVLNKPAGYLVSAGDPHHSRTIYDLLTGIQARVFPVGRLDLDTRGVLILTDDGGLGHRLTHPSFGVKKTYQALVRGAPSSGALGKLRDGVLLEDGPTAPANVRLLRTARGNSLLEVTLHEGRKRQVKRMCAAVGHPVRRLERVAFAQITAGGLGPGEWRHLTPAEIGRLKGPSASAPSSRREG